MIRVPVGSGGRTVELEGETTEAEDVITVEDEDGVGVGVGSGAASPHRPY
jgi:hypothetical protein